jgi:hypothetical protein
VRWCDDGVVVVVEPICHIPAAQLEVREMSPAQRDVHRHWEEIKAQYAPCRAQRIEECLYCPWEACRR